MLGSFEDPGPREPLTLKGKTPKGFWVIVIVIITTIIITTIKITKIIIIITIIIMGPAATTLGWASVSPTPEWCSAISASGRLLEGQAARAVARGPATDSGNALPGQNKEVIINHSSEDMERFLGDR